MEKIAAHTIIVTPFAQNCTLLYDKETQEGVLIDPGGDFEKIIDAIEKLQIKVQAIWITHGHIDHVGIAKKVKDYLKVPIYGPHKDDEMFFHSLKKTAHSYQFFDEVENFLPDHWLEDGQELHFSGHVFQVFHLPGHAPGHVIFFNAKERLAIVGDVIFRGSIGRTDLLGSSYSSLMHSIEHKLLPLGDDVAFLCGHGPGSTIGYEKETNPFLARIMKRQPE